MTRMRILQIVHGFPPDAWAGTEIVTLHLAQELQARGHAVTVLTRTEDSHAAEFSMREEQYETVPVLRVVNNHGHTTTFRAFYDNSLYDQLFLQLLKRVQPEVVHFQHIAHFSANLIGLARAHGYPTILSLHDFFFPCHRIHLIDKEGRLCAGPERGNRCVACLRDIASAEDVSHRLATMERALLAAQRIITPSTFLQERIADYFPAVRDTLHTVPLGIKPVTAVPRSSLCPRPLRLLYSGLLFPPKGAYILIEALQGMPPGSVAASLYGATLPYWQPYVDQLHAQAAGLPIRFHEPYRHTQFSEILAEHDVLVMPMICEETFSLVTREALAAGLPVVAARRGALPAVIEDGVNGLLFEPENPADLRRCLLRLVHEPHLIERLRSVRQQFKTVSEYAAEMEGVYREVCGEGKVKKRDEGEKDEKVAPSSFRPFALSFSSNPAAHVMVTVPTVSVLIPTKNGVRYLAEVLDAIRKQQGDFQLHEIIAADSGSRDGTLQILQQYGVTVVQIPPQEFGHGRTRNLLASHAHGEMLVFLTQDATPANEKWLHNLLSPLRTDPHVAGVYSRHIPRPDCHPMEWHRIAEYELQGKVESRVHAMLDNPDYERNRYLYRFFANTSSVLRRSFWERFPFPEVDFAEDQAWAEQVLKAGYKTAYAADSVVIHSHSYGPWANFCRHFEHAAAMHKLFGDAPQQSLRGCIAGAFRVAKLDLIFWRQQNGHSKEAIVKQWAVPAVSWHLAGNVGYWLGEQVERLPGWLVRRLSFQEQVKRR
ncbi:MAG: glycosyltransferase [Deltaproteobacteria bacterium]|nr:glycosyltransferase [Deltaproteobacteria bacterium]